MKTAVESPQAPTAIGPYSQAVRAGHFLFLSGQIGLDPERGELVSDDVGAQTARIMENLRAVLTAVGANLDDLVKTTIFLTNLEDFTEVNSVYGSYFTTDPPARATVQVSRLPRGARVEIEGVAFLP